MTPPIASRRRLSLLLATVPLAAGLLAFAPAASAATTVDDRCGLGATGPSGLTGTFPEPQVGWFDICSAEAAGVAGAGPLRAVSTKIDLNADVDSGTGARYSADFATEHCFVHQNYLIYPGPQEPRSQLRGHCEYRQQPCEFPESEAESAYPGYTCGDYEGEFDLHDNSAMSVTITGRSVTIVFDPNKLPSGRLPGALAEALAPQVNDPGATGDGSAAENQPPDYGSLEHAGVGAAWHTGVQRVFSSSGVWGENVSLPGPIPLD